MHFRRPLLLTVFFLPLILSHAQTTLYVSTRGNDDDRGTVTAPLKTLAAAVTRATQLTGKDVVIEMRGGTYYIDHTINISGDKYLLRSLTIQPYKSEKVIIAGATPIQPNWKVHKNGLLKAVLHLDSPPDRLFMNGKALPMARYPNYDSGARVFNGTAADAIAEERVRKWKAPAGGYIHTLHSYEWGDFHYRITGKNDTGGLRYEGGWQNNRPAPMHKTHRFVENIFEELDAPGEWFYDSTNRTIYLYPPRDFRQAKPSFSAGNVTDLIHLTGDTNKPVKNVTIRKLHFTQTARSFMSTMEPLLRSDWTIYRGGAILLEGTEGVRISECTFSELGGNAIFLSRYNRNDTVQDNHIHSIGASAVAVVGSPEAVRSPAFRYEHFVPWQEMDYVPGPKSQDFPQLCIIQGNLIHNIGTIEKQVAGVQIAMASHITVSRNTIYRTPRSGINIGDGCWGGHLLAFNDVFHTVLETGDHGAFNSWGRDRYWRPERPTIDSIVAAKPGIELLDARDPVTIRNNRFHCDHGWDIDLDDGSSNYRIYNNVCLNGGLKLREGYHRSVKNNVLVNNTFHPHVWLKNSGDSFVHNIVTAAYAPILMENWGSKIDSNFFLSKEALEQAQLLHLDSNSRWGEAMFREAATGNYQLSPTSPAFEAGFSNFDMEFGVTHPELKKLVSGPPVKALLTDVGKSAGATVEWLGARFKNIESLGERSATGLADNQGALLATLPAGSVADRNGLRKGDVILKMYDRDIRSVADLLTVYQSIKWMGSAACEIVRDQSVRKMNLVFK